MFKRIGLYIKKLEIEIGVLYYAYQDEDTPFIAKVITIVVVGYALSPIDFIPDFIPLFGYLDDVILLPLGIALATWLMPNEVMERSRQKAMLFFERDRKSNKVAAGIILLIWVLILGFVALYLFNK